MTRDDVLKMVGEAVLCSQALDALLDLILTWVLQDGKPMTKDHFSKIQSLHHRKPLGFFFAEMKKRADYSPVLKDTFDRFLENRNRLVHRFHDVDGHQLSSDDDIAKVSQFLSVLLQDTWNLIKFFSALIVAWQEQTGVDKGSLDRMMPPELQSVLQEIKVMSGFVDEFVFPKG